MNTETNDAPDAPVSDLVGGMPPAWGAVYDRFREGHAAAVLDAMDRPDDPEAQAVLHASSAAVRLFRQEYQKASTESISRQIGG
jgi:hypothetical protein